MIIDIYRSTKDRAFFATKAKAENFKDLQEQAAAIDPVFHSIREHDMGLNLEVKPEILLLDADSLVEQINKRGFGLAYIKVTSSR